MVLPSLPTYAKICMLDMQSVYNTSYSEKRINLKILILFMLSVTFIGMDVRVTGTETHSNVLKSNG